MIKHYIKLAFRNILKYRQQSIVSVAALSVGFICFALSFYWVRYELGFDKFHTKADRIYSVREIDTKSEFGVSVYTPRPLSHHLESHFPEIKATAVNSTYWQIGPKRLLTAVQVVDSSFFDLFDVELIHGSFDLLDEKAVLVTQEFADEYFGSGSPVGKEVIQYDNGQVLKHWKVSGVVKNWPKNTNLKFCILAPDSRKNLNSWGTNGYKTYIWLKKGTDVHAFKERFEKAGVQTPLARLFYTLVPLTVAHYTQPIQHWAGLAFEQVLLLGLLGLLVVICSLFNYLNLYANRIQMRAKELSLRITTGATNFDIFMLLITEFCLLLFAAFVFGFIGIEWLLPAFKKFAAIESDKISIYGELLLYMVFLILFSFFFAWMVIVYTRRWVFRKSMRVVSGRRQLFGRAGLFIQLVVGLGFLFCTTIYYKQIQVLGSNRTGVEREGIMSVLISDYDPDHPILSSQSLESAQIALMFDAFRSESAIESFIPLGSGGFLSHFSGSTELAVTDNMGENEKIEYDEISVHPDYLSFFGLQLLSGRDFRPDWENNRNDVIINESAAKALGFDDPVGKSFYREAKPFYHADGTVYNESSSDNRLVYTIIGVVKDFVYESPLIKIRPVVLCYSSWNASYAVKSKPGQFSQAREAVKRLTKEKLPGKVAMIFSMEQEYKNTYRSELSLRPLLALLSCVSIVVSLFGIYSMVSLMAERRRKEIAVRKVSGASLSSILALFLREYLLLLVIGALVAFPAGYLIMKPWTEKFILQTSMGPGLFLLLFLLAATVIGGTVVWRIWRTAHINPSIELKKE